MLSSSTERLERRPPRRRWVYWVITIVACLGAQASRADQRGVAARRPSLNEAPAAAWLERHREQLPALRQFAQRLPKGGDIHTHLSGAVYAERYLRWAMEDGYCVDAASVKLVAPQDCGKSSTSFPAAELFQNKSIYQALIDRWSLRNLAFAGRPGHDQFFQAFAGFDLISSSPQRKGDMLAEVAERASSQVISYLELMLTTQGYPVQQQAQALQWNSNLAEMHRQLMRNGLAALVSQGSRELAQMEERKDRILGCGTVKAQAGCQVTIRYLQQANRTRAPREVFAQMVYGFELAKADARVVGINLVAPEDDPVALRDYGLQMAMLQFLRPLYPGVKLSLHAGELTLGLVPPDQLRSHIRQAVEVARAERIGHGVAIGYEDDAHGLLTFMRQRRVLVEICLTSNEAILQVQGPAHPLPLYWSRGVPLTLASDDEGISRIDLSNEYQLAVQRYRLSYPDLKQLARNSLEYSFLAGPSLWTSDRYNAPAPPCAAERAGTRSPSSGCAAFLATSDRARAQWRLEADFAAFEALPQWRQP